MKIHNESTNYQIQRIRRMSVHELILYAMQMDSENTDLVDAVSTQAMIYEVQVATLFQIRHKIAWGDKELEALHSN